MFYHPFLEFDMETGERRKSEFPLVSGSAFADPEKFLWYAGQGTCVSFRRKFLDRLLPIPEEIRMLADGYLGSLIVFVAPILADPDCLSAYRFHGKNSYHADESEMSAEIRGKRLRLFRIEFAAMRRWLAKNGYTRKQLPVRAFLDWWSLYLESQEFLIAAPSRLQFFWWTVRKTRADNIFQNWRFTFFHYLTALSALIFGYTKADRMHEWRGGTMEATKRVYRTFFGHTNQSSSGY